MFSFSPKATAQLQSSRAADMAGTVQPTAFPRSPSAIIIPILAAISCILCLPVLVTHIKSRNLAASVLTFWIALENVFNVTNPIIWPTDDWLDWWLGYGLCDVEVKLTLASSMAYIGALVCIYSQLASVLNTDRLVIATSPAQRRRRIALEVTLCFGLPVYIMVAHYVVQPSRYYIFAIGGCELSMDPSWPSTVLVAMWPLVLWLVAAGYCTAVIYRITKYRREFSNILSASQSRVNKSRFIRLFALATTLLVLFAPIAVYSIVSSVELATSGMGYRAYSWNGVHTADWTEKIEIELVQGGVGFDRWIQVATGYIVFVSFGFGEDALVMYRGLLTRLGFATIFPGLRRPNLSSLVGPLPSAERSPLVVTLGFICKRVESLFRRPPKEDVGHK